MHSPEFCRHLFRSSGEKSVYPLLKQQVRLLSVDFILFLCIIAHNFPFIEEEAWFVRLKA